MKERQAETKEKLSKYKQQFLSIIMVNPDQVFDTLSYLDIIKPLVHKDYLGNGGKRGYGGLAEKYEISEQTVKSLLGKTKENKKNQASSTKIITFIKPKKKAKHG